MILYTFLYVKIQIVFITLKNVSLMSTRTSQLPRSSCPIIPLSLNNNQGEPFNLQNSPTIVTSTAEWMAGCAKSRPTNAGHSSLAKKMGERRHGRSPTTNVQIN